MNHQTLFQLAMWGDWQKRVEASLPNFAAHPIYVDQSQSEAEYQSVADYVFKHGSNLLDPEGMLRDAEFGARVVKTTHGELTRMWLDSAVEFVFLIRHMPDDAGDRVLDIGAGYGRLAVALSSCAKPTRYVCVDPVPISTQVCRKYCERFAPNVEVPSLPDLLALHNRGEYAFDLAINVHSWNECTREQIGAWLDLLDELKVPLLFTVSHGDNAGKIEGSYYAWEPGRPSWRPLIEERYELIAEESIGFSLHPHALWRLKKSNISIQ